MESHTNPPAIVIYIVDAFLSSNGTRNEGGEEEEGDDVEAGSIWLLGLLRCYTEMLQTLPETMRPALMLQVFFDLLWPGLNIMKLYCITVDLPEILHSSCEHHFLFHSI